MSRLSLASPSTNRVYDSQAKTNMLLSLASEGLMRRFGRGPLGELRRAAGLPYVKRGMVKPVFRSLAARITGLSVLVALVAIAVIVVGVLGVAQSTFDSLMVQAGTPAAEAHAMFDHAVANIFPIAVVVAILVSAVLAAVLSARLTRPLQHMSDAAHRVASGDYETRVPRAGPQEVASLADSFNQMAMSLADQERARRDFIVNAAHELRTPLTNLQGYLEALRDGVIAPTPEQFGSLHEEAQRLVRLSRSLDALAENDRSDSAAATLEVDLIQALRFALEVARPAFRGEVDKR